MFNGIIIITMILMKKYPEGSIKKTEFIAKKANSLLT